MSDQNSQTPPPITTPEAITEAFTHDEGFHFARWSCPLVPMVYGVDDASMALMKGGVELMCDLTGQPMEAGDPETGYNHVTLFLKDWSEMADLPAGGGLDFSEIAAALTEADAAQHRVFRFDDDGGIVQCFQAVRLTGEMTEIPGDLLALGQALVSHLHWGPQALAGGLTEPPAEGETGAQLRTDLLRLLRAAYDPVLPVASRDPALAYRIAARLDA